MYVMGLGEAGVMGCAEVVCHAISVKTCITSNAA